MALWTDKPGEECGVFGIAAGPDSQIQPAYFTYNGLFALQHRGQESCGIAVCENGEIKVKKDRGLLTDVFDEKALSQLTGHMAVGHVRYSTLADLSGVNTQPTVIRNLNGTLSVAFNGALVNSAQLKREAEYHGAIFHNTSDAEIIAYMIMRERLRASTLEDALLNAMEYLSGAYCAVIMSGRKLIAVRDPNGFRPLCMGRLDGATVFASESCALDAIGADFVRDIEPGEIISVCDGVATSKKSGIKVRRTLCVFEYIYFARPDSVIDGVSVSAARLEAGRCLARSDEVEADVVVGVPDSGLSAAMGYSQQSGIPFAVGLIKNRYIGRTLIQPSQGQREHSVRIKLNALKSTVNGKRVVLVDDSIVRGTTCTRIVSLLREAGATEVHMRVSAPPFLHPCYFGTDIPDENALIASGRTPEQVAKLIGADSLIYLRTEDLPGIVPGITTGLCDACYSGDYSVPIPNGPVQTANGRMDE